jgi:hypothetical protein
MIKKENGKWNLYTKDGKTLLSTHATEEEAIDQRASLLANRQDKALTQPDKDGNRIDRIDFRKRPRSTYPI